MPLHYAIVKHFDGIAEDCAAGVIKALKPKYRNYKLFTRKDIEEALATAKENGLLDETRYDIDNEGVLRIYYSLSNLGRDLISRYL